ncbi:MAG: hypothetical protein ACREF3_08695 [Acetobacteraceae bacterium]
MADTPIEPNRHRDYPSDMESRVAILETIAQQTAAALQGLQAEMRGFRSDLHQEIGGLRSEMKQEIGGLRSEMKQEIGGLRSDLRSDVAGLRRIHDRDFRLTFAAIITTAVGLAALIAHVAHWL